jgi:competence protein ComGC
MSQLQVESQKVNFEETRLLIPASVLKLPLEKQCEVYNYLIQMSESQKKAYLIAQDHLGTSFNILKSNGFIEWKKNHFTTK